MPTHEQFEAALPDTMSGAAAGFPPPSSDLLSRSVVQGVRLRRVRAVRMGAAAVAVAAITAGGALGISQALVVPKGATPAASAATSSRTEPAQPARPTITAEQMVQILVGQMPAGGTVSNTTGRGVDPAMGGDPSASLTYTNATGASSVDIAISRLDPGTPRDQQGQGNCLPIEVRPYDTCTVTMLSDRAQLTTVKSFTYPSSNTGQRRWYVVYTTVDGVQVDVEEFGGGGEKTPGSSATPILSASQLASIARSPAWNVAIAALPPRAASTPFMQSVSVPSGTRMTTLLTSMLPRNGHVSNIDAGTGLVELEYDDGHGRTMVEVDDQTRMTDSLKDHMNCQDPASYCTAFKLADGTQVQVTKTGSEKGGSAVVWLVDTLHPDGQRGVVRDVNSDAESAPPTRPLPALTLAQLQAIALDGRWFQAPS
jgi:hypothetical protein